MPNTRKVLILSYYFPPMGMGGTQRVAKFCKYLPDFGWSPIVITVKPVVYYAHDSSLMRDVKHVEIFRTHSLDPLRLLALRRKNHPAKASVETNQSSVSQRGNTLMHQLNRLLSWIFIPDTKVLWLPYAIIRALKIIRKHKIEIIFTSSPPHSIHLGGIFLKFFSSAKLVCDFRDEWTGGESQPCPTKLHLRLNRLLEKFILKKADAIVGICQHLVDNLYKKSANDQALFAAIMNGFDADDFKSIRDQARAPKFTIVHCGSISKVSNPETFLLALKSLFHEQPDLRNKIAVKFVGIDVFGKLKPLLEKFDLTDVVEFMPYMPHQQAIASMMQAHVLLLIVIKKTNEEVITSKVFEYLATGRRILAIIPPGELAEILSAANAGKIIHQQQIDQIKQAIASFYAEFIRGSSDRSPSQFINRFERRNLTGELAAIFNKLPNSGRSA